MQLLWMGSQSKCTDYKFIIVMSIHWYAQLVQFFTTTIKNPSLQLDSMMRSRVVKHLCKTNAFGFHSSKREFGGTVKLTDSIDARKVNYGPTKMTGMYIHRTRVSVV